MHVGRHAALAGELNRLHLAFDAPLTESARHQNAVKTGQQSLGTLAFNVAALNSTDPNLGTVPHARVVD